LRGTIALRPIFHVIGILLSVLGLGMLVPALADVAAGNPDWSAFVGASAATLTVSGGMVLATSGEYKNFTVRQHFLLTALSWVVLAAFGALPFMISTLQLSFADAYFEAISGLSTTGSTVILGLDTAPPGVLLWRALLSWFGGIGIIVMAIAVLPVLRVGGMQLFRTESSDKGDKPFATVQDTAGAISMIYLSLTLLSAVAYHLAGMSWFDAICHAMTSVSTGGFSTKDASLAWFDSHAVLWVATLTMICGALPLTWYIRVLRNVRGGIAGDSQVKVLLGVLVIACGAMTLWTWQVVGMPLWDALTHSTMNVTSIITTTGYVSADYSTWGSFATVAFFFFLFIGGCTGSTTGSIKIFRWQVLAQSMLTQMQRMLKPHRVLVPLYQGKPLDDDVIGSVINFAFAYMIAFGILSLLVAAMGVDFLTATTAVAASLGGAGPGLGPIVGPAGTFAPLPDAAKWVMSFCMLLGRLEVFTVLVLILPSFWRD
jgi:trk system potassium uptake protein TrkH